MQSRVVNVVLLFFHCTVDTRHAELVAVHRLLRHDIANAAVLARLRQSLTSATGAAVQLDPLHWVTSRTTTYGGERRVAVRHPHASTACSHTRGAAIASHLHHTQPPWRSP